MHKPFFHKKPKQQRLPSPPKDSYIIYTDGSALENPGPGGYGVVAIYDNIVVDMSKGYTLTTNNRMEIMAVIVALEEFGPGKHFTICTDSQYVIQGATEWLKGWIRNEWIGFASGTPVKNADLWKILDELLKLNKVNFFKVAAHVGDPLNERADQLAKGAAGLAKAQAMALSKEASVVAKEGTGTDEIVVTEDFGYLESQSQGN